MKYGRYMMSCVQKESFCHPENRFVNLGDNIQALAIDSIYEQLGISSNNIVYIKRDYAEHYQGPKVRLPFHSEFIRETIQQRINTSKQIEITPIISAVFYDKPDELQAECPAFDKFVETHGPVGCRDERTKEYLRDKGIAAYLMGCFTILFRKRKSIPQNGKVFFVDVSEHLIKCVPEAIKYNSESLTHAVVLQKYPADQEENMRIDKIAKNLLNRYANEARMVVTSRLHAAIPCIAMGIPVILAADTFDFRFQWIEKLIHPYSIEEYEKIDWDPKPVDIEPLKEVMLTYFDNILHGRDPIEQLKYLDRFYSERERIQPLRKFRHEINLLSRKFTTDTDFNYTIWGAGIHSGHAYTLMSEIFPKAHLVAIVDKYKNGTFHQLPIIRENDLGKYHFDHILITTTLGTDDALHWIQERAPNMTYTIICSQQKS